MHPILNNYMKKQIIHPQLVLRLLSTSLDFALLTLITTPIMNIMSRYIPAPGASMSEILMRAAIMNSVNIIFITIYFVSFWIKFGATPGKMLLKMRIVDKLNYNHPSKASLVKRFLGCSTFLFGLWLIPFSKQKQALHDRIADTVVIKT